MDITEQWTSVKTNKGSVIYRYEYEKNGITYHVDGRHVILKPSVREIHIANVLAVRYGKTVEVIPRVNFPQGIKTPDYIIDGATYDLKTIITNVEEAFYNSISKKKNQATNFILDISTNSFSEDEILTRVLKVYTSTHTKFVEKMVIIKDDRVIKAYSR